jgi:tetrahydromethanopterin S-methyltransferase subunit D
MKRTYIVVYEVGGVTRNAVVDIDAMTKKRDKPRHFRPRKDSAGAAGAL